MDKKQICSKFAREICTILQIEMPAIRFVSIDRLRTDTQIAALTPDGVHFGFSWKGTYSELADRLGKGVA